MRGWKSIWSSRGVLPALALLFLVLAVVAEAHQVNLSTARVEPHGDGTIKVEVALKGSDADRLAGTHVFDAEKDRVDPTKLITAAAPIAAYIAAHMGLAGADGASCTAGKADVLGDGDGVVIRSTFDCSLVTAEVVYRSTVLTASDRTARQIVLIGAGDDAPQALLDDTRTTVTISAAAPSLWATVEAYLLTGIEHIFLGYDHVAFLIAIVLWAERLWPVIKIVTAFTVAHSITLSLAALEIVVIPSTIVEPAIAASILFVAVENFFSRNVDGRWRVTFAFGLIHGFGFAGALQELGLPKNAIVPALASFNLGVEIGQIAIVAIVVPALLAIDRLLASDWAHAAGAQAGEAQAGGAQAGRAGALVSTLSVVIAVLAGYWFLARTFFA